MSVHRVWGQVSGMGRWRWALLGLAVAQVVSPVLSQLFGGTFFNSDPAWGQVLWRGVSRVAA